MLDKITFITSICPNDRIYEMIGLYFDHINLLHRLLVLSMMNYQVLQTNASNDVFEVILKLADASTAMRFKSVIDLNVPLHRYDIYGRSLTVNTTLNNDTVKITIGGSVGEV